jgi:hypothetical protein
MRWWPLSLSLALVACASQEPATGPANMSAASVAASVVSPAPTPPPPLSPEALMAHVMHLASPALAGRRAFSPDEETAAHYVLAQLEAYGASDTELRAFDDPRGKSHNVVGTVRCDGCSDWIIVGAHLDHMGWMNGELYLGAEDNASGVAVVLEIARALVSERERLGRNVALVFFGAEEVGLVGSRAFVAAPPFAPMRAMVNVDMIGRRLADRTAFALPKRMLDIDDARSVGVMGTKGRPGFRSIVDDACAAAGIRAVAPEDLGPVLQQAVEALARGRGDNAPFEAAGVPTLFFSSGESDDYHQPSDTVDRIEPEIMAVRARAIRDTVLALSKRATLP